MIKAIRRGRWAFLACLALPLFSLQPDQTNEINEMNEMNQMNEMNEINQINALIELRDHLKELLGDRLVRFVLYGSRARGDYEDESDIDLAIIVQGLTRELKNRILDQVAEMELRHLMPISAIVLSEKDFVRLRSRERRIALDIESEGIPI